MAMTLLLTVEGATSTPIAAEAADDLGDLGTSFME